MSKLLIFAGTTEGRRLAELLSDNNIKSIVSVATEYGKETMPELANVEQKMGRLDAKQIEEVIRNEKIETVVDATHPFATVVSENIKNACENADAKYLRLKRDTNSGVSDEMITVFSDSLSCAKALEETEGNILLTTGSKELGLYCENESVRSRLYVRVLPGEESISLCAKAGINGKQIIAMQGPFSQKLNEALIEQFDIKYLVTKESGKAGGLDEKLEAAINCGIKTFLIGSPDQSQGLSLEQVLDELGVKINNRREKRISLVGIGMGNPDTLTMAAKNAIDNADYLIGARRMIEPYRAKKEKNDIYLAKDIIPYIEDKAGQITILFSGDSGFYSGCKKLKMELENAGYTDIEVIPGISSISYLSSISGIPWSEAEIFSVHGKGEPEVWKGALLERIMHSPKTFLLLSGVKDVNTIGQLLIESNDYEIVLAKNLSYPDEELLTLSPEECAGLTKDGLYTCIIINKNPQKHVVTNSHRDDEFIRAKVPMTKEEIRTVSISKLRLQEDSVVWDVGSGTGSIAVEMAGYSAKINVYAVEHKSDAVELIKQNASKFNLKNVNVIEGKAPAPLYDLPAPDCVFIGGSGGELEEILNLIYEKNQNARVVINAVSLETIAQVTGLISKLKIANFETVSMSVSRSRSVGSYNLFQAENPVMIFSFDFVE